MVQKVIAFATKVAQWEGTGKELADALDMGLKFNKDVRDFVSELRTLQTALESQYVLVGFKRSGGKKLVTIKNEVKADTPA